ASQSRAPQTRLRPELLLPTPTLGPAATFILKSLAEGALQYVGGQSMGWVMQAFGFGDSTSIALAQIQQQLAQISAQITALQAQLSQVAQEVQQGNCDSYSKDASVIISDTETGAMMLQTLASTPRDAVATNGRPLREVRAEELKNYIRDHLLGKPLVLHNLLVGLGGGQGLITACGKAIISKTAPFIVPRQTKGVRDLVAWYQDEEISLLDLVVEYWHAIGENGATIAQAVANETTWQAQENAKLKPDLNSGVFLDTRTGYAWTISPLTQSWAEYLSEVARVPLSGLYGFNGWWYPNLVQVQGLYKDWVGQSALVWLIEHSQMTLRSSDKSPPSCFWVDTSKNRIGIVAIAGVASIEGGGFSFHQPSGTCYALHVTSAVNVAQYQY
ncbi:MAG: hypothetical protein WCF24_03465, partial [Acidimicrobiales bacterium]